MDLHALMKASINQHASDLHLIPGLHPLMRIHGDLLPYKEIEALPAEEIQRMIYEVMTKEQQQEFEETYEYDMALSFPDVGHFRVNIMRQLNGISVILRIIPKHVPTFEDLSLPAVLKTLLIMPHGLVLVTGPTGSGKSTTLAAMVEYINAIKASHIITIEDPIEFIYTPKRSSINQRQVRRDTKDVKTALRSALRQDPDVILLGEMRDLETIRLALTAAETGHLVMATLHASSAPLAVSRIVDFFPAEEKNRVRNLLAESLQAVICQNLVKKIGGGRVGAFEIMLATPAVRHLIREDKITHMTMTIQTSGDIGMCSMEQYLQMLVQKGVISLAQANGALINNEWKQQ